MGDFGGFCFWLVFGIWLWLLSYHFLSGTYVSDPPMFMDHGILGACDKAISGVSMTYLYNVLCCVLCCL